MTSRVTAKENGPIMSIRGRLAEACLVSHVIPRIRLLNDRIPKWHPWLQANENQRYPEKTVDILPVYSSVAYLYF